MLTLKASVCNPRMFHGTNRMNFERTGLSFPVYQLHYPPQASRLFPAIRQKLKFESGCTKEGNPSATALYVGIGSDSTLLKHSVPKFPFLQHLSMLWFIWYVVSSLLWLMLKLRREAKSESYQSEPYNVSFDTLVGADEAKSEFKWILKILRHESEYKKQGLVLPHGVLVYGPPGTGKTTLVHAMAREAGVSFFPVCATQIHYDDSKAFSINSLFTEAKRHSPSIIFIEYIDAIARPNKYNTILKKLRITMDKCKRDGHTVLVIASTNEPEKLDSDLFSSGWFYTQVHMDRPDEDCRRKIIGLYFDSLLLEEDKEAICNFVTSQTHGLVANDIIFIADKSCFSAYIRGSHHVTMDDVVQGLERCKQYYQNLQYIMSPLIYSRN